MEGPDDKHVVAHLLTAHSMSFACKIRDAGGIQQVLDAIPIELRVEGRTTLGILVDANDDFAGRWQSLGDILRNDGYRVPKEPDASGTVIDAPIELGPKVGVWLMPDNRNAGELEDFVGHLVPDGDPVWPRRAEAFL